MHYTHSTLAAGRWFTMSFAAQMGNIGSEVGRALRWQSRGEEMHKEKALERAFELMDLMVQDTRWLHQKSRLKEIVRVRDVLVDFFYGINEYGSTAENLEKYFYYFAYASRIKNV